MESTAGWRCWLRRCGGARLCRHGTFREPQRLPCRLFGSEAHGETRSSPCCCRLDRSCRSPAGSISWVPHSLLPASPRERRSAAPSTLPPYVSLEGCATL